MNTTAVREMPEDDRPRERIARLGAEALRDAELLAVLFRTGTREHGAVALAEALLKHFGNDIRRLGHASIEELQQVRGIGMVKAVELKAAIELGRRVTGAGQKKLGKVSSGKDIAEFLMHRFRQCEVEHFKTVLLNIKNEVLKVVDVSQGTVDGTYALPPDVFRQAVREGAAGVIVAHNHPSGDPEPSKADLALTRRLADAALLLNIKLVDHVIIGDGRFVSFKERNLL